MIGFVCNSFFARAVPFYLLTWSVTKKPCHRYRQYSSAIIAAGVSLFDSTFVIDNCSLPPSYCHLPTRHYQTQIFSIRKWETRHAYRQFHLVHFEVAIFELLRFERLNQLGTRNVKSWEMLQEFRTDNNYQSREKNTDYSHETRFRQKLSLKKSNFSFRTSTHKTDILSVD